MHRLYFRKAPCAPFFSQLPMKKFLLFSALFAALTACQEASAPIVPAQNAAALATPYVHNGDTSIFHVKDYSIEEGAVLSGLPAGVHSYMTSEGVYKIFGRPTSTLGTMRISTRKQTFEVPFIKGQKRGVQFRVAAFKGQDVKVKGEFNAWNSEASFLKWDGEAWVRNLVLAPGEYAYKLVVNGQEVMDPTNDIQQANGMGGFNNLLSVPYESQAEPRGVRFVGGGQSQLMFTPMPEDQEVLVMLNNRPLACKRSPLATIVELPEEVQAMELSWVRLYSARGGKLAPDALVPLRFGKVVEDPAELGRENWHTSIMYFAMIDRFYNGNAANDKPVEDPSVHPRANYQGGDLAGFQQKIEDGYFDSLGVNTLWISPLTQNPEDAWGLWNEGGPTSTFSGYHGYWPVSNIKPDHRFATEDEVHSFLAAAHARENNVLLDYVANHVHELHPVYQQHPEWATPKYTEDGRLNTQLWDEERLTTWFDTFMPTLELRNDTVADLMSDSALVWINQYAFDGFRHDATKHIPMNFTRLLTEKIRANSGKHIYQIGETYGSDELIASYVGSGKVDAQFNFNLYDAAFEAFTQEGVSFDRLKKSLQSSLTYYGYHHLMGNISGNQDKPRFASVASGDIRPGEDAKLAGWTRDIPQANERGFRKMACMHAFNIAVPGIPIFYYGDEIAMHGGNDPDNRKMMRFNDHNEREKALWTKTGELIQLRRSSMALNYGGTDIYQPEDNVLVIERQYANEFVRFFFNNNAEAVTLDKWGVTVPADDFTYQTEILQRD